MMPLFADRLPPPPPGEDQLPCDDGEPMETERHRKQMNLLTGSLELAWKDRHDFYVGGNMNIYFSDLQVKKNDFRGPDVFVVLDTVRREHKSWVVWQEEGRTPDVVIELLSPSTEQVDRGEKMRIYARLLRVSHYYLFDPINTELEGYKLDTNRGEYVRMAPLSSGILPCTRLGLQIGIRKGSYEGVEAPWLRWIDDNGNTLPTAEELAQSEHARAEAEKQAHAETTRQLEAALAELAALKAAAKG